MLKYIVVLYHRTDYKVSENKSNLRKLPVIRHWGREVEVNGKVMLNLSSNDYLGLAAYLPLRTEFLQSLTPDTFLPSSSSSRLLTGNFNIYVQIEDLLARLFRKESALVFNSGYHMNAGILPAVTWFFRYSAADEARASASRETKSTRSWTWSTLPAAKTPGMLVW